MPVDSLPHPLGRTLCSLPALASLLLAACSAEAPPPSRPQPVFVSPVQAAGDSEIRQFSAILRPRVESDLGFRQGGAIRLRAVELGQRVRAGQLLAEQDPVDLQRAVQAAEAQLRAAQVDQGQAEEDATRFAGLARDGAIGQADAERQRSRAEAARAQTARAQQALQLEQQRLGHSRLLAPFDGVITAVRAEAGQVVGAGQPVLGLAREGTPELQADLPESLPGGPAAWQARLLAGGQAPLPLTLREQAPIASAQGRTLRVRYALPAREAARRPELGLGRSVELLLTRRGTAAEAGSVRIPVSALLKDGAEAKVWQVVETAATASAPAGARLQARPVEVLAHEGETLRVRGLQPGERIVSVGAQKLDAGLAVAPRSRP